MKTLSFSLLAAALATGAAFAATAYTTPVGYETNNYIAGFNPVGVRLHSSTVAAGTLTAVGASSVTDSSVADFATVLGTSGASGTYVLEINNGSGIYQLVTTWSGSDINVAANLTGEVSVGASYSIRFCDTLSSVFGATNNVANSGAGLGAGGGGPASSPSIDQIWVPDGSGGYNKYYYDSFAPPTFAAASWAKLDNSAFGATAVDGSTVLLPYPVGVLINAKSVGSLVVTGEVKTEPSEIDVIVGFNVVGTVSPAGATLSSTYGAANESGLGAGGGGPASSPTIDQVWVPNGSGGYDKYYYDNFAPPTFASASWAKLDNSAFGATAVDGSTVSLPSAILFNAKTAGAVFQNVPSFYSNL